MSLVIAKEDLGKAILAVNITAKLKVLFTLYIISKMEAPREYCTHASKFKTLLIL